MEISLILTPGCCQSVPSPLPMHARSRGAEGHAMVAVSRARMLKLLTTARETRTNRPKSTRFWPQCWRLKWENKIILMLITSGLYFFRSECKNTIFVAVSAMEIKENNT